MDDDFLGELSEEAEEEEIEEEEEEEEDSDSELEGEFESELSTEFRPAKKNKRITPAVMSKYEQAAVIAKRANEIRSGAQPYISLNPSKRWLNEKMIAQIELEQKLLPYYITRVLSNGHKEIFRVDELEIRR